MKSKPQPSEQKYLLSALRLQPNDVFIAGDLGAISWSFQNLLPYPGSNQDSTDKRIKNMEKIQIPALFHKIQDPC